MNGKPENPEREVYLDNNATTRPAPEVVEAMEPFLRERYGNPSSAHLFGRPARQAIMTARESVVLLIGADPAEIVFCSGGSEANNMAIKGAAWNRPADGSWKIVTTAVEHSSVLNSVKFLAGHGYGHTVAPVDETGLVDIGELAEALDDKTALVTVMHANNEVGTVMPVKEIAEKARERGIPVHTDAVQTVGKIPVNVKELGVDFLSISAHKLHGPKGIGALYIRSGVTVPSLISGGHHERGRRAGTENVAGIVGLGKTCELALKRMEENARKVSAMRDELEKRIVEKISGVRITGNPEKRLPNTLGIIVDGVDGETLMMGCDMAGIAVSTGSACASGAAEASHVLTAMRLPTDLEHGSLRISFSSYNSPADVDYVMEHLPKIIETARRA